MKRALIAGLGVLAMIVGVEAANAQSPALPCQDAIAGKSSARRSGDSPKPLSASSAAPVTGH